VILVAADLGLQAAGIVLLQWLPHATGMRFRRRDRQRCGGDGAHEQQNQQ
jgi:hypothetical protein